MNTNCKISLIGFMGAGKSTVAKLLADKLCLILCEVDDEILSFSGLQSVSDIFSKHGESYFRELESEIIGSLRTKEKIVISTGGGAIIKPENLANLKANSGLMIYLRATFQTHLERIGDLNSRPLFKNTTDASQLFTERSSKYEEAADIIIDTDNLTAIQTCDKIIQELFAR